MASVTKASIAPDNTALGATLVKNAADVKLATNSNSDNIALGYSAVSDNDTHVKTLDDAIVAGTGITVTETDDGADESLVVATTTTQAGTPATTPALGAINVDTTNDRVFMGGDDTANTDWLRTDGAMVLLASDSLIADVAGITITGWPTDNREYHKLILEVSGLESNLAAQINDAMKIQVGNGSLDTTAGNYFGQDDRGAAGTPGSVELLGTFAGMRVFIPAALVDASHFGVYRFEFYRPEDTDDFKFMTAFGGYTSEATGELLVGSVVTMWKVTSAITHIGLLPDTGTTFLIGGAGEPVALDWRLYGVY